LGGDASSPAAGGDQLRAGASLEAVEKRLLEMTLESTGGNRSRAAKMLGVSLRTVRNKIREYGLPPKGSYGPTDMRQDPDTGQKKETLCP
jgi:DNA-binding NtrC family response regulator